MRLTATRTTRLVMSAIGILLPPMLVSTCMFHPMHAYADMRATISNGAQRTQTPLRIGVRMFPSARVVRNLSNGQNGIGYLVYYLKSRDPTKASLIVKLVHVKGERSATAYVYQVAGNSGYIPYHVHNGRVFMEKTERPAMVMDSLTGNWIQDGHAALNLDIRIYSPFTAMWEPVKVSSLWTSTSDSAVKKSRPIIYTIQTRTYPNGVPKWDLRQVLPSFTASLLRTNYAQRERRSGEVDS